MFLLCNILIFFSNSGIDSEGHAANFVETEQIVHYSGSRASFVQASYRICEAASQLVFSAWIVISCYVVRVYLLFSPFKSNIAVYGVDRVHPE